MSPILGGLLFWKGDDIAGFLASEVATTGQQLAAQWPASVLTRIILDFTGKIAFSWRALHADDRGVLTQGTYAQVRRDPSVAIQGPAPVEIRRPNRRATTL
jgi:hypothetical protein